MGDSEDPASTEQDKRQTRQGALIFVCLLVAVIAGTVLVTRAADRTRMPAEAVAADAAPPSMTQLPWFAGGTLHGADSISWRNSELHNRLATSADWSVRWAMRQPDGTVSTVTAVEVIADFDQSVTEAEADQYLTSLLTVSVSVMVCIDEVVASGEEPLEVAAVAVWCFELTESK